MDDKKGEAQRAFTRALLPAPKQETQEATEKTRRDQPVPRPRPPGIGKTISEQSFDQRWNQQAEKSKALDPFDAVDERKKSLQQQFDKSSGIDKGQERE